MRMVDKGFIDTCISLYTAEREKNSYTNQVIDFLYQVREGRISGSHQDFYNLLSVLRYLNNLNDVPATFDK